MKGRFLCRICGRSFDRRCPCTGNFPTVCYLDECRREAHRRDVAASAERCKVRAAGGRKAA